MITSLELKPSQIRALLILLVLLPFIPTVLMVRFIVATVSAERDAAKERTADLYQRSLATVGSLLGSHLNAVSFESGDSAKEHFRSLVVEQYMDGAVIYDDKGRILYPRGVGLDPEGDQPGDPRVAAAYRLSLAVERFEPASLFPSAAAVWTAIPAFPESVYGLHIRRKGIDLILLRRGKTLLQSVEGFYARTFDPLVSVRIVDGAGGIVPRVMDPSDELVAEASIADTIPGWGVHLFLKKSPARVTAAFLPQDQAAAFALGTAIIANLFIAGLAAFAVSRQLRLNELRNSSLATVSHELKTPISAARVLLDTLLDGRIQDAGATREYIEMISQENHRLARLIEKFLTAARIERSAYAFNKVKTLPSEIVDSAVAIIGHRFKEAACPLEVRIEPGVSAISVDRDAIVIVLVNLLENALKYTGRQKEISLLVREAGKYIIFEVRDNGAGIARRYRKAVFERFFQVDQKLSRMQEGAGLGLSIVKSILDAHGGKVKLTSSLNEGSVFAVSIPTLV